MPELYKADTVFPARDVYDVWIKLVQDEELYEAMLQDRLKSIADEKGLTADELAILHDFKVQPGTVWHVENLRFRCVTMVSRMLELQLRATTHALTRGDREWLRDLVYHYMSKHRWVDYGHHRRFAECERFVAFVRNTVIKGRRPPEHIDDVLAYELAAIELLRQAASMPLEGWPSDDTAVTADTKLQLCPIHAVVSLQAVIVDWLQSPEGSAVRCSAQQPVEVLRYVVSPEADAAAERLDERARRLLEAASSPATTSDLAAACRPSGEALVRAWVDKKILVPVH